MDDFIDYGEEGRPTRRKQSGVSRELEEAREEADAIFGTDAEMQELLDFTRGDKNVDYDDEGEEGEEGAVIDDDEDDDDDDEDDDDDDGFIVDDDDDDDDDGEAAAGRAEKREKKAERRARKLGKRNRKLEARTKEVFDKLYDRETMEAHYQTSADEVVRREDVPERLQLDLEGRAPPLPKELEREARHILGRLFPDGVPMAGGEGGGAVPMATGGEGEDAQGIKAFSAAIANVLKLMREGEETVASKGKKDGEDGEGGEKEGEDGEKEGDASAGGKSGGKLRFELSFIEHFRKEDYAPLTAAHLALIPELDLEYAHLQTAKAALLRAAQAKLGGGVPELDERLETVRTALRTPRRCPR